MAAFHREPHDRHGDQGDEHHGHGPHCGGHDFRRQDPAALGREQERPGDRLVPVLGGDAQHPDQGSEQRHGAEPGPSSTRRSDSVLTSAKVCCGSSCAPATAKAPSTKRAVSGKARSRTTHMPGIVFIFNSSERMARLMGVPPEPTVGDRRGRLLAESQALGHGQEDGLEVGPLVRHFVNDDLVLGQDGAELFGGDLADRRAGPRPGG